MICPSCRKDTPTVLRGVRPYCTACGAARPLSTAADAVNLAGQPAKVGGSVVHVAAVLALFAGGGVALVLGLLAQLLFHTGVLVATPIFVITLLVSLSLFFGGRKLRATGEGQARSAQRDALIAMASASRGVVKVQAAARALSISETEADALLTAMARDPASRVTLEIDDAGELSYVFQELATHARFADLAQATPTRSPDAARERSPDAARERSLGEAPKPQALRFADHAAAPPLATPEELQEAHPSAESPLRSVTRSSSGS